ncbi:MAG: signal peptidase II [Candidatus Brocadiia bacterium]
MTRRLAFWLPALLGLAADLLSKHLVFQWLAGVAGHRQPLLGRWLVFSIQENRGGPFGILQGRGYVFVALSGVALVAVVWMLRTARRDQLLLRVALGFVVAGALGNVADRLFLGHVRDFIYIEAINYPAFNVADVCVCLAAGLLVLEIVRQELRERKSRRK